MQNATFVSSINRLFWSFISNTIFYSYFLSILLLYYCSLSCEINSRRIRWLFEIIPLNIFLWTKSYLSFSPLCIFLSVVHLSTRRWTMNINKLPYNLETLIREFIRVITVQILGELGNLCWMSQRWTNAHLEANYTFTNQLSPETECHPRQERVISIFLSVFSVSRICQLRKETPIQRCPSKLPFGSTSLHLQL